MTGARYTVAGGHYDNGAGLGELFVSGALDRLLAEAAPKEAA